MGLQMNVKPGGRRIVYLVAAALVVLAAVGAGVYLSGGLAGNGGSTSQDGVDALAARMSQALEQELAPVRRAVKASPEAAAAVNGGDAARKLAAAVRASHPGVTGVHVLPRGHRAVDYDASPPLTYAVIEMLENAENSGRAPPPAALLTGTDDAHIAVLIPLAGSEGKAPGHVFVALDVAVVEEALAGLNAPAGRVQVIQPVPGGSDVELAARGSGSGTTANGIIPRYGWRLTYTAPGGVTGGGSSPALVAGAGTAVVLVAALAFLWWRGRRRGGTEEEAPEAPVVLGGAVNEVGAMSHDTVQFVVEDYVARRGSGGEGIDVVEGGAEASADAATEMDFTEAFADVEEPAAAPGEKAPATPAGAPAPGDGAPPASLFRAYDIRGPVATGLDADAARAIGRAVGSEAASRGEGAFAVGRDGRQSSPELAEALIGGLVDAGMDVIDVGLVPTPVVYFAAHYLDLGSCVAVTGSHNPASDNGFKVVIGGATLSADDIKDLRRRIVEQDLVSGDGKVQQMDVGADYIRRISEDIPVALGNAFKLVVDCANGATSELAPRLYRALGHDVVDLFCKVDGSFPNHPPDPTVPANLEALQAAVREHGADLGLALDGDGDRLVVVDAEGTIIWPDRLLMVFARDVLERNPAAEIVFDVKCSARLPEVIAEAGGKPVMYKSGHAFMKAKMAATAAPVGGEMAGHFFFRERWYGFDDGLYAGARLLEVLQAQDQSPAAFFAALPQSPSTPELRVAVAEGDQHAIMARMDGGAFKGATLDRTDGIRAQYPDGWGLVRGSNTTASLVFRFEADDEEALARIQGVFRGAVAAVQPDLALPF